MPSMPVRTATENLQKGYKEVVSEWEDKLLYRDKTNTANYIVYFLRWIYMQIKNKAATYCDYTTDI